MHDQAEDGRNGDDDNGYQDVDQHMVAPTQR